MIENNTKKILIIEDYKLQSFLMEEVLGRKYEIKSLDDSLKAPEMIKKYNPDLIILDIVMPNKCGVEILEDIDDLNKVIVVSSIPKEFIKPKIKALGVKWYLEKPINLAIFKDLIDERLQYIS